MTLRKSDEQNVHNGSVTLVTSTEQQNDGVSRNGVVKTTPVTMVYS